MRTIALNNGAEMPALGLGTWKSEPGAVGAAVREALRLGYRHVDCAPIYGNEREVGAALGEALAAGELAREDLWVTSKLWNDRHDPKDVVPALRETLDHLGLERLDLFLVHWPVALKKGRQMPERPKDLVPLEKLPLSETWKGMVAALEAGLTRAIGVSNCSERKLRELHAATDVPPAMNQVELHPYLTQERLVAACMELGVAVTAYSPLGSPDRPDVLKAPDEPRLLDDPVVREVAERVGATPGQVLIAWALHRGTATIPKSVNAERLAENLAAADLELSADDVSRLSALDRHRRYVQGDFWCLPKGPYTLASLWDE